MKIRQKNAQDRQPERNPLTVSIKYLPKSMLYFLIAFSSIICLFYSPKFLYYSSFYCHSRGSSSSSMNIGNSVLDPAPESPLPKPREETNLSHVVFGIAASAKLWNQRKNYIKLWWRSNEMQGIVWLDEAVEKAEDDHLLPTVRISGDTSEFVYGNPKGHRSAIRISRIVSETLRLGFSARAEVRWLVMGDLFLPSITWLRCCGSTMIINFTILEVRRKVIYRICISLTIWLTAEADSP